MELSYKHTIVCIYLSINMGFHCNYVYVKHDLLRYLEIIVRVMQVVTVGEKGLVHIAAP